MTTTKTDFLRKLMHYFNSCETDFRGKGLCVCLSGGADSVALLRSLILISDRYGFHVYACHFNHMIRGDEAYRDEEFCIALCNSLGVKLFRGWHDVPEYAKYYKMSLEEAARDCRYSFFNRVCEKDGVDYCVTAHNMNDDAETLLFNLIRGSGINGATAIAPKKEKILRPLLKFTRSEIEDFLDSLGQTYVKDSTNDDLGYSRNYIRHKIIPDIQKLNPSVIEALARYIESSRNDREYFDDIVENNLYENLQSHPKAIRHRVIIKKYKYFSGRNLTYQMVNDIDKALVSNRKICIPLYNDDEAVICDGFINYRERTATLDIEFDEVPIDIGYNKLFGDRVALIINSEVKHFENINKISISNVISFDNIKGALHCRNRRIGDKILINGMHKSVKKLFIEKKIPKEYRDIIPIIMDSEGIIYIPFVGISDRALCKNGRSITKVTTVLNTVDSERWGNAYEK